MQALPMIISAVGTAVSTAGMIQQGRAAEKMGDAQARGEQANALQAVYDSGTNEAVAKANEKEAMYLATEKRNRALRQGRHAKAKATGQLARQGLDVGGISFSDVLSATIMEAESVAADSMYEGAMQARSARFDALGFKRRGTQAFQIGQYRAGMARASGKNQKRSAYWSAAGNAISGLGDAYAMRPGQ